MINIFLLIVCVACLYAIKGGQHHSLSNRLDFLDGSYLSAFGFFLLCWAISAGNPFYAGLCWFVANVPSMGEQAGGIGGYKGNWDDDEKPYPDPAKRRKAAVTGWKTGLQRGVFTGALLCIGTGVIPFIYAGALFPVAYWIGISIEQWRTGQTVASWRWAEWIYGGALGAALYMGSV